MSLLKFITSSASERLVLVLRETIELLSLKENDFAWSHWSNAEQAKAEMESHISALEAGDCSRLRELELLFGPTGSIQEVSESSGWGNRFLKLAKKFDRAVGGVKRKQWFK